MIELLIKTLIFVRRPSGFFWMINFKIINLLVSWIIHLLLRVFKHRVTERLREIIPVLRDSISKSKKVKTLLIPFSGFVSSVFLLSYAKVSYFIFVSFASCFRQIIAFENAMKNLNRKFLLSFFCVYKTQNGKHARFYINALLMQDLNMFIKFWS